MVETPADLWHSLPAITARQAGGRQVGQPVRKLPAQGPGPHAAPTFQVSKTWKRFAEAGQQLGDKARDMATGQAWQGQLRQTCRPAAQQAGGRLGSPCENCRLKGQAPMPPRPSPPMARAHVPGPGF